VLRIHNQVPRLRSVPGPLVRRGELTVERDPRRPSGRLLRQGGMDCSYIDLADPSYLEFDYLRWSRIVIRSARARRVVHVGGGACALARALAAQDPDGRQEVCEVNSEVLELARSHMGLRRRPGLRVRQRDGREFVTEQTPRSWDAVVVDAFVGATVPPRLITAEAMSEAARIAPLVLVNVVDDRAARLIQRVASALHHVFPQAWMLGGRAGNTLVVGDALDLNLQLIASRLAADPSPGALTDPVETARRVAGRPPYRDNEVSDAST
jgi:hypothetical protein